jgi:hypothetical protein
MFWNGTEEKMRKEGGPKGGTVPRAWRLLGTLSRQVFTAIESEGSREEAGILRTCRPVCRLCRGDLHDTNSEERIFSMKVVPGQLSTSTCTEKDLDPQIVSYWYGM